MRFSDIVGQEAAAAQLKAAIDSNRMPHALLISGREGSGAMSLALAAAQYILCPERIAAAERNEIREEACDECPQCIQSRKLQHPDLHFVFPVVNKRSGQPASTSEDFMEEWRTMLLRNPEMTLLDWTCYISEENKQANIFVSEAANIVRELSTKPYESDYRIMIVWLPERLQDAAANKLLKIIEEPYEKTHFLLVSIEPERVMGTILSRCQRLNLPPLRPNWMQPQLDGEEREQYLELFKEMMRKSYMRRIFEMKEWSNTVAALGRQRQQAFLQYAQSLIRENFIMNLQQADLNYMQADEEQFSGRFSLYVNHLNAEDILTELATAENDILQNANPKMVFFDLSLKLIMLLKKGSEGIQP